MASTLLDLVFGASFASDTQESLEGSGSPFARRQDTATAAGGVGASSVLAPPDEALVEQIRSGDRNAFDILARRYHVRLVSAATAALGTQSEAEDIVQDVLLRVWMNHPSWAPTQGAAAYLFGAVTNRVRNVWRDRKRAQLTFEQLPREAATEWTDTSTLAEEIAEVWDAVGKLPPRWRTALILRYLRDASFADVGRSMQISENAAKKLVQRAIAFLSETLK